MTREEEFSVFWKSFPNRKGKGDAIKAFKTAIKLATIEEMLDGITRYVANKPDWQAYKYPGSWLRGQHWSDEWETPQPKAPRYKDSYVPYNVDKYSRPQQAAQPVLPKNHFLNTYGK